MVCDISDNSALWGMQGREVARTSTENPNAGAGAPLWRPLHALDAATTGQRGRGRGRRAPRAAAQGAANGGGHRAVGSGLGSGKAAAGCIMGTRPEGVDLASARAPERGPPTSGSRGAGPPPQPRRRRCSAKLHSVEKGRMRRRGEAESRVRRHRGR